VYVALSGFGTAHIFKSTDAGATWIASSTGLPDVPTNTICIDPSNPNTIYTGNDLEFLFQRMQVRHGMILMMACMIQLL